MSDPLRILIIDDEPLARESIRALLAGDAEVRVVGEGAGSDAAALIARTRPDLLFLDVQMPEVDGFGVLDQVGADTVPAAHLLRQTMDEIEKQLDSRQFFRVHRSAIVNVDRVREIHPRFRGDCARGRARSRSWSSGKYRCAWTVRSSSTRES